LEFWLPIGLVSYFDDTGRDVTLPSRDFETVVEWIRERCDALPKLPRGAAPPVLPLLVYVPKDVRPSWDEVVSRLVAELPELPLQPVRLESPQDVSKGPVSFDAPPQAIPAPAGDVRMGSPGAPIPPSPQGRRADLRLERSEEFLPGLFLPRPVPPRRTLAQGATYRVRLQLGRQLKGSMMVEPPPPIDPLLPPPGPQGYELQAAIYPLDFTLVGEGMKTFRLPVKGASEAVLFKVLAPAQAGPARLRVCLYHHNHMVQSFLVTAEVAEAEAGHEAQVPRAELEFSRSERFTNLEALTPRALCIGVNQDAGGSTHTVMVKGQQAGSFHLTEQLLAAEVARFRAILKQAAVKNGNQPGFPSFPAPGQVPSPEYDEVIRQLAEWGGKMFHALFGRAPPPMEETLRGLTREQDTTIQIVRHDPNFILPWTALYDFRLPDRPEGEPPPPVCNGFMKTDTGEAPCGHRRKDATYCVRGFWGVRHRVEQLLGVTKEDAVQEISGVSGRPRVHLAIGTPDTYTQQLSRQLREQLGPEVRELTATDSLLDILWSPTQRPAQVIILGHLETRKLQGEPPEPRLVLPSKDRWLRATTLMDRTIDEQRWEQPRSLVFLMACSALVTEVGTPNDLLLALTAAGAAAIIGTECVVFTGLVARFTQEVTDALWRDGTLGSSVHAFRLKILKEGNPMAFAFSVYGDAELRFRGRS
jgi:hypothetical protein